MISAVQSCVSEAGPEFVLGRFGSKPASKRNASIRFKTVNRTVTPLLRTKRSIFYSKLCLSVEGFDQN